MVIKLYGFSIRNLFNDFQLVRLFSGCKCLFCLIAVHHLNIDFIVFGNQLFHSLFYCF
ncbi:MAG: Uncharacterised protein [Cyanobium sp. ARS6]|nr:MAG: Uncharacterised protein [Cyanobium sp. ARS6]